MNKLDFTEEQREEHREKTKATLAAKVEAAKNLKDDFMDKPHWNMLASKYGVRLPRYYIPGSEYKYVKRTCNKLGFELSEYIETTGCKTLKELVQINPTLPSYAIIGGVLEWWDEKQSNTYVKYTA